ncbi:structural maintenance of chromosomes protein [Anaeramoeba ignava]|uniref:Structural maintenance of chromosomes protein n=1 Tax=Anaeramoeba ignava TaxID=1746090 RepID=A0A9Q0LKN9_ANAIG|nr:structural maintenance of chromosomes protein [Anaeramoeba ignava]
MSDSNQIIEAQINNLSLQILKYHSLFQNFKKKHSEKFISYESLGGFFDTEIKLKDFGIEELQNEHTKNLQILEQKQKDLDLSTQKRSEFEETIKALQSINEPEKQKEYLQNIFQALEEEEQDLKEKVNQVRMQKEQMELENNQQKELNQQEIDLLVLSKKQNEEMIKETTEQIQQVIEERKQLKEKMNETSKKENQERTEEEKQMLENLEKEMEELKKKNHSLNFKLFDLKKQFNDLEQNFDDLTNENSDLQFKRQECEKDLQKAREMEKSFHIIKSELVEMKKEYQKKIKENEELNKKIIENSGLIEKTPIVTGNPNTTLYVGFPTLIIGTFLVVKTFKLITFNTKK